MSEAPLDLLLLAAHPVEFTGLTARLGPGLRGRIGGLEVAASPIGVGLPAAAAGTALTLAHLKPRAALLLGSFGHYPRSQVGAVLCVRAGASATLLDGAIAANQAELPGPMPPRLSLDPGLSAGLAAACEAPPISIANTLAITTDLELATRLGGDGRYDAENLEAYAVALSAAQASVPLGAVLVSTNAVGPVGRAQWLEHHRAAAELGSSVALAWLDDGAPGMPRRQQSP